MEMILVVLLTIPVGVTIARRDPAARHVIAVRRRQIGAALQSRMVAKLPDSIGRIGVHSARESHATMHTARHIARRHVHHATQRRRPVQR